MAQLGAEGDLVQEHESPTRMNQGTTAVQIVSKDLPHGDCIP